MVQIDKDKFLAECNSSISMSVACANLGLHFNTFKRYAVKFGCYKPNPGLKGGKRIKVRTDSYKLQDILDGKYPGYSTWRLKNRLLKVGLKKNKCEVCGIDSWQNKPLNMELHHLDGIRTNHKLCNLQMICGNCHAQTSTFRSRNR